MVSIRTDCPVWTERSSQDHPSGRPPGRPPIWTDRPVWTDHKAGHMSVFDRRPPCLEEDDDHLECMERSPLGLQPRAWSSVRPSAPSLVRSVASTSFIRPVFSIR
ncbi:hypothetical protein LR48_Vigan460s000200 [Vigna angularis]|uniref:Uncharacterized protein n=1 Tax=Phaseolus angularis TaxID=3914 RepID=A0A0L9TBG0_PHAAN|nr:hypothetical protein LR48_Vigan460s000200 [Vigna angularis]